MSTYNQILEHLQALKDHPALLEKAEALLGNLVKSQQSSVVYEGSGLVIQRFETAESFLKSVSQPPFQMPSPPAGSPALSSPFLLIKCGSTTCWIGHADLCPKHNLDLRPWNRHRDVRSVLLRLLRRGDPFVEKLIENAHPVDLVRLVPHSAAELDACSEAFPGIVHDIPVSQQTSLMWARLLAWGNSPFIPPSSMVDQVLIDYVIQHKPSRLFCHRAPNSPVAFTPELALKTLGSDDFNSGYVRQTHVDEAREFIRAGLIDVVALVKQNPGLLNSPRGVIDPARIQLPQSVRTELMWTHPGSWCMEEILGLDDAGLMQLTQTTTAAPGVTSNDAQLVAALSRRPNYRPPMEVMARLSQTASLPETWWSEELACSVARFGSAKYIPVPHCTQRVMDARWERSFELKRGFACWDWPAAWRAPSPHLLALAFRYSGVDIERWGGTITPGSIGDEALAEALKNPRVFSFLGANDLLTPEQISRSLMTKPLLIGHLPVRYHTPEARELAVAKKPECFHQFHAKYRTERLLAISEGQSVTPPAGDPAGARSSPRVDVRALQASKAADAVPASEEFSI